MIKSARSASMCLAVLVGLPAAASAEGASGLRVVARIDGPDGGWDYASFDPARRRVYVAHGMAVMMIDADSGKVTPQFAAGARLHAVTPVPGTNLIVTTNSGDSSAKILDAQSGRLIASIATSKGPDGAIYDPHTGLVLVVCADAGLVALIDPKAARSVGEIQIGDSLEFLAVDGAGRLFVNIEDKGAVAVVDLDARKVLARYPMNGCRRPTGLAFVAGGRLVSSCSGVAKILDARSGREIASLTIGGRPDAVLYDESRRLAYIPSADGTLAVIALSGAGNNTVVDSVQTQPGARTGAVDPRSGRIYLPTARYDLPIPANTRPTPRPGTFQVLVLGRGRPG